MAYVDWVARHSKPSDPPPEVSSLPMPNDYIIWTNFVTNVQYFITAETFVRQSILTDRGFLDSPFRHDTIHDTINEESLVLLAKRKNPYAKQ